MLGGEGKYEILQILWMEQNKAISTRIKIEMEYAKKRKKLWQVWRIMLYSASKFILKNLLLSLLESDMTWWCWAWLSDSPSELLEAQKLWCSHAITLLYALCVFSSSSVKFSLCYHRCSLYSSIVGHVWILFENKLFRQIWWMSPS